MTGEEKEKEAELVRRASQGDINAFEEIYRRYNRMVYSVAYRITGNAPDAEEAMQDVFVAAHRSLKDFRMDSSLKTWLYRIAVNRALNAVKKSRMVRSTETMPDYDISPDDQPNNIEQHVDQTELQEKVARLLAALDPEKRACLTLRAIEGLSYEEISSVLGVNINTVRTRLKRARQFLLNLRPEDL